MEVIVKKTFMLRTRDAMGKVMLPMMSACSMSSLQRRKKSQVVPLTLGSGTHLFTGRPQCLRYLKSRAHTLVL